jgi:hypothetical protein
MTIFYPLLCGEIYRKFWYLLKRSHIFLGILKVWDIVDHMTTILKGIILNIKIDRALN